MKEQDRVAAWIKRTCWDMMQTQRVKLYAMFTHYQVENFPVLPTQRELWPELALTQHLRGVEMELDGDLLRPWLETTPSAEILTQPPIDYNASQLTVTPSSQISKSRLTQSQSRINQSRLSIGSQIQVDADVASAEDSVEENKYVLSGSDAHKYVEIPPYMIPQTQAHSYLQMNELYDISKLNVQNLRLWFNKQFDELYAMKKREVSLVLERNERLRFIVSELNKLSDLRGSFHHLAVDIRDPEWRQEEEPHKLIKVEPEECSIEPYISPSQIVIPEPESGPKDDFRERALIVMMDGVLETLWWDEIKKEIPKPLCMLDKDPETFNEDDLRLVFEYEAKVAFRNEERQKYRKMLHAEYAKLSGVLNEGIVKFNAKVKETWLMKLQVDACISQERLNLMRLRRTNLDRIEMAEKLETMRTSISDHETALSTLTDQLHTIQAALEACRNAHDALIQKQRHLERSCRNQLADMAPVQRDQCLKYFKKRPKWVQRATMTPVVLYELATAVLAGVRPPLLHGDCLEYFKGVEQLDNVSNMPAVLDEALWACVCRLRRANIDNEIRMKALVLETAYVESAKATWTAAINARRAARQAMFNDVVEHRRDVEVASRNKTIQLVLPAGQVEVLTSGYIEDFEDAALIPRDDVEAINNLICRVGEIKLRIMRKQMDFRRVILAREWQHAQSSMRLRHLRQQLHSYTRLQIPKELQWYLKNKELGGTDEQDLQRTEREVAASRASLNRMLDTEVQRVEDMQMRVSRVQGASQQLNAHIDKLHALASEKRLGEDPFAPIRVRREHKRRMATLVERSRLIRQVQANHSTIVLLQTELELLRLKTYPTLATFRTLN
ncbi:hypothetical protein JYU34_002258 [Plutella xylostella]|uniref:Uncharacterized protein n=1 Tax=Plutella xylostella TaxID=51655 RepID=A0ABQ7R1P3_PLUXY|nr:hypothetical protein JYU34_002258 [Plutella xylostella]